VVFGLSNSAVYVLLGVGISLIFGVLGVVNFAHGQFMAVGAFISFTFIATLGLSTALAGVLIVPAMAVIGAVFYVAVLRPMQNHAQDIVVVATFGLAILLQGVSVLIWGGSPKEVPRDVFAWQLGEVTITRVAVVNVSLAIVAFGFVAWLLARTRVGREIRATAQSRTGAELIGVQTHRAELIAVVVATVLTGLAAIMIVQSNPVSIEVGFVYMLKAFAVAVVAGLGRVTGVLYAGLILGIVETLVAAHASQALGNLVLFAAIIVTLLVRPAGLASVGVRQ
jgi:branched-chain amino acid transport system permease protein